MRAAALVLAALALTGCETSAEKSARLERAAMRAAAGRRAGQRALTVTTPSRYVKVLGATLVRGREGTAAAVTLRNTSARALKTVPVAITVTDRGGRVLFQNNEAGLEAALASVASLPAGATLTWVDDQLGSVAGASAVSARAGEAPVAAAVPRITISGLHVNEATGSGSGAEGTVTNESAVAQHALVVFVAAVRGARTVAAARSVISELPPRSSRPFQAFFLGDPRGATLHASAPASSLG